jgi:hypothetical protein
MHEHLIKFIPDLRFQHPCSLLISGTTGAGKSHFVKLLIENDGIKGGINKIFYFMPRLENLGIRPSPQQQLFIMEGLPTQNWVDDTFTRDENKNCLIVVDDLWSQCIESPVIESLLTYGRRHLNVSLAFIAQNFYEKSRKAITLR